MTMANERIAGAPARRLSAAAVLLALGYAALCASLVLRHAVLLTILIPAGVLFFLAGIVLWLIMVVAEARSKDMV